MSAHDDQVKPGDLVHTLARVLSDRAAWIVENMEAIAVRVEIDGKWQAKYLYELPVEVAIEQAFHLLLNAEPRKREGE